jgi:hypothetical protein
MELRVLREEFVEMSQTVRKLNQRLNTTSSLLSHRLLLFWKGAEDKTQAISQEMLDMRRGLEENVRRYGVIRSFAQQMDSFLGEANSAGPALDVNTPIAREVELGEAEEQYTIEQEIVPAAAHSVHVSGEIGPPALLLPRYDGSSRKRSVAGEDSKSKRQRTE